MPKPSDQIPAPRSAQDAYAELMRHHIGPALRQVGFKGSGGAYTLPDADNWVSIGFQRSSFGDRHEGRFTANLTVASKAAWQTARASKSYLPERPAPNTFYGSFIWQSRIGLVTPGRRDTWWHIEPTSDLYTLGHEVLALIKSHGLPAIRGQLAATRTESASGDITGH